ncbi:hypothetical protein GJ654_13650 [Rhodoblastus acidophilus]|uniref:Serine/threonine protein kinase n=1 Tax=Rhodoblastus acidophilus TaxID=1074 RepID=A0A6N8DS74_RHOAC|nr:hypothetical protein [Rhodoblastus acidophilus]MCW2275530.1 hypothetical protein [Rhodoblastus acidophilus]MTV32031.1 hypothetical protein [Rhodoblastus acidophilus]
MRPDLPAWLEDAIFKAIAVDPAKRYANVLEFAFEIENGARRGGPAVARKTPLFERNPLLFWQGLCAVRHFPGRCAVSKVIKPDRNAQNDAPASAEQKDSATAS